MQQNIHLRFSLDKRVCLHQSIAIANAHLDFRSFIHISQSEKSTSHMYREVGLYSLYRIGGASNCNCALCIIRTRTGC